MHNPEFQIVNHRGRLCWVQLQVRAPITLPNPETPFSNRRSVRRMVSTSSARKRFALIRVDQASAMHAESRLDVVVVSHKGADS
jgi:hypothetical protein